MLDQVLSVFICIALCSPCIAQSTDAQSAKAQFGEINVAPIKDMAHEMYQMCRANQVDLPSGDFKAMAAFKIEPDGSIAKESIRLIHSSGSMVMDKKTIEMLWCIGQSHAFGPLSPLSSSTIELQVDDVEIKLSLTGFAPAPEEAKAKVTQLSLLMKLVGAQQRSRNPIVSELLGRLVLKADNNRIDAEIRLPRAR
jgi:hypothetical protein